MAGPGFLTDPASVPCPPPSWEEPTRLCKHIAPPSPGGGVGAGSLDGIISLFLLPSTTRKPPGPAEGPGLGNIRLLEIKRRRKKAFPGQFSYLHVKRSPRRSPPLPHFLWGRGIVWRARRGPLRPQAPPPGAGRRRPPGGRSDGPGGGGEAAASLLPSPLGFRGCGNT